MSRQIAAFTLRRINVVLQNGDSTSDLYHISKEAWDTASSRHKDFFTLIKRKCTLFKIRCNEIRLKRIFVITGNFAS